MMFRTTFLAGLLLAFSFASLFAQTPDPRDSVILESKVVAPDSGTGGIVHLRVWITNKDTIVKFGLGLQEKSLSNGAYLTLAWPRTFTGAAVSLTTTLPVRGGNFANYHSNSPDSFDLRISGTGSDAEPPNDVRKALWDIKFDTARVGLFSGGVVEFDTVVNDYFSILVVNQAQSSVAMNFVKAHIFVGIEDDVLEHTAEGKMAQFALSQNYPNPFNANTQIAFALPKSGHTTLEVFNVLGQKVIVLMDEYLSAGNKIVNWDGRDTRGMPVPSGIYFYQLRSGDFKETKKMLVLK